MIIKETGLKQPPVFFLNHRCLVMFASYDPTPSCYLSLVLKNKLPECVKPTKSGHVSLAPVVPHPNCQETGMTKTAHSLITVEDFIFSQQEEKKMKQVVWQTNVRSSAKLMQCNPLYYDGLRILLYTELIDLWKQACSIENALFSFLCRMWHFVSHKCFIEMWRACSSWPMVEHVQSLPHKKHLCLLYDTLEWDRNVTTLLPMSEKKSTKSH